MGVPWKDQPTQVSIGGVYHSYGSQESAWRALNPDAARRYDAQWQQSTNLSLPSGNYGGAASSGYGPGAGGSGSRGSTYSGSSGSSGSSGYGGSSGGASGANANIGNLQNIADPFSSQRGQYQQQLSKLMSDPSTFYQSPVYKAMYDQGLEAVNRTAAAKKMLGSGNRLADLVKYGQGAAAGQFFNQANLLAGLSGSAPGSPAGAASSMVAGQNAANQYDIQNRQLDQGLRVYNDAKNQTQQAADNQFYGNLSSIGGNSQNTQGVWNMVPNSYDAYSGKAWYENSATGAREYR